MTMPTPNLPPIPAPDAQSAVPDVPPVPAVPPVPDDRLAAADAGAVRRPAAAEDDLLESISRNFGGGGTSATAKAKRDSLAEMNKQLPDWSLEPPETFLP